MQLKALADNIHQLQCGSYILATERDRAVEMAAKVTVDAENTRAAKEEFMRAIEAASAQLAAERKKRETLRPRLGP